MASGRIGTSTLRIEDMALLTGRGRFVDDIHLPEMLHAAFLRSPYAHARILSIDKSAAESVPGVVGIIAWSDLPELLRTVRMPVTGSSPAQTTVMTPYTLAKDEVCFVGEAVAVVIAQSRAIAEDALGLIVVEYVEVPAVADCREAVASDAALVHLARPSNIAATFRQAYGDIDRAFAQAAYVYRDAFHAHRGCGHAIECRGVVASFDPSQDLLTVWSSTQIPHIGRKIICEMLGLSPEAVRVIAPDIGGGFGPKAVFYPEELALPAAAVSFGRPLKWIEDRREHFLAAAQERDQHWEVEIAADSSGKILGVRGSLLHDAGAYPPWEFSLPYVSSISVPGVYLVPAYELDVTVVHTNLTPVSAIRGSGRAQAVFAMERLLDGVARQSGIDRAEIRRRNLIGPSQMPYSHALTYRDGNAIVYDTGDYPAAQDTALKLAGWEEFKGVQSEARLQGRYLGVGVASYLEGSGTGPYEGVSIRIHDTGRIVVRSGATPNGQGHKTMLSQVCADVLGVEPDDITVVLGDTNAIPLGIGTWGSRIAATAGPAAMMAATAMRAKLIGLASQVLGVPEDQLRCEGGKISVGHGNQQFLTLADLARESEGSPGVNLRPGQVPGLEHTSYFTPTRATFGNGTHVGKVEVDIGTGGVRIVDYVISHDCGRIINPMIVNGQIQGGFAHGVGNALLERMVYDAAGQPLSTNLGEYILPIATLVPDARTVHQESPSLLNPLGAKGIGEGAALPVPAVIVSAIEDALAPFSVRLHRIPVSPDAIVEELLKSPAYKPELKKQTRLVVKS